MNGKKPEEMKESAENKKEEKEIKKIIGPERGFFDKHKKAKILALLAIVIFFCCYIRAYEASLPALDKAAELDISYAIGEKVKEKMYNPLADPAELQKEMQETIKNILREKEFKNAVEKRAETYKSRYRDSAGNPYLVKGDAYFFLNQARGIRGIFEGQKESQFFPIIIYCAARILPLSLIQIAYYLPLLFAVLTCIVIFFLTAEISNFWGGFFAGFIMSIHPIFLDATSFGYADTQIMNIFLSALTAYFFILLLKTDRRIFQTVYGAAILTTTYLFKQIWSTYYYLLFIIVLSLAGYIAINQIKLKSKIKWLLISAEAIVALTAGLYILTTPKINTIFVKLNLKTELYYPNALSYVQELERLTIKELFQRIDILLLLFALGACIYLIYQLIKKPTLTKCFLITWFISLLILSSLASRLLYFFMLPFVIVVGYGAYQIFPAIIKFPHYIHLRLPRNILEPIAATLFILIFAFAVHADLFEYPPDEDRNVGTIYSMSHRLMDDSIEKISKTIMMQTKEDSVINTWWDLGYLYRYYARRRTIADGATQNSPNVYWFAKSLASTNETEAVKILRMIDCGRAEDILIDADCDVPDSVVIISDYEIKRNPAILKTAEWDFKLASIYDEIKDLNPILAVQKIKEKYPEDDADEIYSHMTQYTNEPPESKITIQLNECTRKENNIFCGSLTLDLGKRRLLAGVNDEYSFKYITDDEIISKNTGSDKTIIIYYEGERIRYASVDSDFVDSLLVRLYFLEARDLENFELLDKASYPYAKKIKAFWIRWEALNSADKTQTA